MNRSSFLVAAVVAGLAGLLLLVKAGSGPGSAAFDAALGAPLALHPGASAVPAGPGQVRGRTAAHALVRAFPAWSPPAPDPGDAACPCDGECGRTSPSCTCGAVRAKDEALLASHRLASAPLVAATAGDDGTFALSGLSAGATVDVWVEGPSGLGRKAAVAVGTTDVEIAVEPGVMLAGSLTLPTGAAGTASVVAFSDEFGRVFESGVDGAGRSLVGPLPSGVAWRLLGSWADQRGTSRVDEGEAEFELRFEGPALVAGMVIASGTKAPGASVRLDAPRCHLEAKADADGRFSFTGFGSGGLVVSAESNGRTAAEGLVLSAGESKQDVVLDLSRETALAGTVRGADGKGVAGAEVSYWLRQPSTSSLPGLPIARRVAACSADGAWSAASVAPGSYSLQATAPGFAESEVSLVEVARGERGQVEFTLAPQSPLAGRVVDPLGKPVDGAEITVRQEAQRLEPGMTRKERAQSLLLRRKATARSASDGTFKVDGLAAGPYSVSVAKEGFGHRPQTVQAPDEKVELRLLAAGVVRGEVVDERGLPVPGASLELTARSDRRPPAAGQAGRKAAGTPGRTARQSAHADAQGRFRFADLADGAWTLEAVPRGEKWTEASAYGLAAVEVQPGAEAEVRLALAATLSIAGVVVDTAGRPVEGAKVTLAGEDRERSGGRMPSFRTATSAADGMFALRGLTKGAYRLSARKVLFKRASVEGVQAGTQTARLELEGLAAVRGQVVDVLGRPVTAFEANGEAVSDPEGRFAVAIRRSETMSVTLSAPGFAPSVRSFPVMEGQDHDAGRVVLTGGRRVTGKAFEAATRTPVAGVRVHLGEERLGALALGKDRSPSTGAAVTDGAGAFALQVEDGLVRLEVDHPRYKRTVVEVPPGVSDLEVPLARGATLRGRVLDREGHPQRALLFATSRGGGRAVTEVEEDGNFELGGLAGGTWHVNATASDGAEQGERLSAVAELAEGGEATVELRPKTDGGTLVVTLKGADASGCGGMLLPGPEAGARSVSLPPSAGARDGALTFRAVEPGRYTLVVSCGAGKKRAQASQPVDVVGKGQQTLELAVPAP